MKACGGECCEKDYRGKFVECVFPQVAAMTQPASH